MSAGFAVWCSDPTEFDPEDRDEFEHFCDAHGLPHTEQSWDAFEDFLKEPVCSSCGDRPMGCPRCTDADGDTR